MSVVKFFACLEVYAYLTLNENSNFSRFPNVESGIRKGRAIGFTLFFVMCHFEKLYVHLITVSLRK